MKMNDDMALKQKSDLYVALNVKIQKQIILNYAAYLYRNLPSDSKGNKSDVISFTSY